MNPFARTELLLGREAMARLAASRVAVFGIGGVGGYVCEALARSGIGALDLIDSDVVSQTNLNRQIIATVDAIGRPKVEVMAERVRAIHPACRVTSWQCFFLPDTADSFPFDSYDYVVDAVDTVTAKLHLILTARAHSVPVISAMGAGNKLDPGRFRVSDIYDTAEDPLARVMRRELRRRGVEALKVVWSDEPPLTPQTPPGEEPPPGRRALPGSFAPVPAVAGLLLAAEVLRDLQVSPQRDAAPMSRG